MMNHVYLTAVRAECTQTKVFFLGKLGLRIAAARQPAAESRVVGVLLGLV